MTLDIDVRGQRLKDTEALVPLRERTLNRWFQARARTNPGS